ERRHFPEVIETGEVEGDEIAVAADAAPQLAEQVRLARPGRPANYLAQCVMVLLKTLKGTHEGIECRPMNIGHVERAVVGPDAVELGCRRKVGPLQGSECLRGIHG